MVIRFTLYLSNLIPDTGSALQSQRVFFIEIHPTYHSAKELRTVQIVVAVVNNQRLRRPFFGILVTLFQSVLY